MSKNLSELSGRKGLSDSLFNRLGEAAVEEGTPSKESIQALADEFLTGVSSIYGATTFYDFLKPENKGKTVYVCNGTACQTAGTQDSVIQKLKEKFPENEIGHMTCLGRCHENNAFHFAGRNFSGAAIANLDDLDVMIEKYLEDQYHVGAIGPRILTKTFPGLKEYYLPFVDMLKRDSAEILNEIKLSGLRGRGGAGFPIGTKLEYARIQENNEKFIICNADEGDPGAYSDRFLLEKRPHSVLFGMMTAGYVTGATTGVLYIRAEYPEAVETIQNAIEDLRNNGLIGRNINKSGFDFEFKIIQAQGAYICGEETALINSIEGQRPEVRVRPPYPAQQGLFNKPTVVNNVETLAVLPYIVEEGGAAWKDKGTEQSSGTKLVSLDSFFKQPGIYEIEMGTPLKEVIDTIGGGFKEPVKAMQIGGPLGGVVPLSKISDLTLDYESFAQNGFLLGHASIVCIPNRYSMMEYIRHLFEFAAYESCGKCFPCRLGTKRGLEMSEKAIQEDYKIDSTLLTDLLTTLERGSLCAHGGGIPLPIRNILTYFPEELKSYFKGGRL